MRWWFKQQLHIQIIICILIGIGLGLLLGSRSIVLKPAGELFIRFLKMLIVPLTLFTLISGITKMGDLRSLRSVGGMTVLYYLGTSLFAAVIGTAVALVIKPGRGAAGLLETAAEGEAVQFDAVENIVSWVPENPVQAMAEANMLQIIIFSVIVGIALLALGKRAESISKLVGEGAALFIRVTEYVMALAPYGILALIAVLVGNLGTEMLAEVGRLILSDTLAVLIILVVVYPALLMILAGRSPVRFYRNAAPAMLVAASTTSSSATLPVSMRLAGNSMGIPDNIYGFTLPLGTTVNMDGMAAALGVIAVFAAHLYGMPITLPLLVQFVFLGLLLSVGTAGIKGAGIIMSSVLLKTLNLPLTLVPILAAVWPVIDIAHTTCNVTGDLNGTAIVASRLGLMNDSVFDGKNP